MHGTHMQPQNGLFLGVSWPRRRVFDRFSAHRQVKKSRASCGPARPSLSAEAVSIPSLEQGRYACVLDDRNRGPMRNIHPSPVGECLDSRLQEDADKLGHDGVVPCGFPARGEGSQQAEPRVLAERARGKNTLHPISAAAMKHARG